MKVVFTLKFYNIIIPLKIGIFIPKNDKYVIIRTLAVAFIIKTLCYFLGILKKICCIHNADLNN